jgi:Alginate export
MREDRARFNDPAPRLVGRRAMFHAVVGASRSQVAVVLVAIAAMIATPIAAQEPDRPTYRRLRYEEDWSVLRDPARRTEPLDRLKYIPLTADGWAWLSLGGEIRERYEYTHDPTWGQDPQDEHGVLLQRYTLHTDLHLGPNLRVFEELLSALANGRAGGASPVDEDQFDILQAFFDLSLDVIEGARGTVRIGRQEVSLGSGRLVDIRAGPNVPRSFNGARVFATLPGGWRVDGLVTRPTEIRSGVFDDKVDDSQALWGVYALGPLFDLPTSLDAYYLGYHNAHATYQQGTATETRHTLGVRVWGERSGWDWNWELIGQLGTFGNGHIAAWSVASETGYTWGSLPWTPRLGLKANVASGDRNPADRNLQTFNPLYPRGNYFSELSLLGPRNFYNLHPSLTVSPRPRLALTMDVDCFWRLEATDGVYNPSGQLLRSGAGSQAHYVATELSLNAAWQVTRSVALTAIYSHSFPGPFIRDTGPSRDIDFVELTFRMLF